MDPKTVVLTLVIGLLSTLPVFIGCGLFDDNSQPTIKPIMDQRIAVDSKRTVEVYITDPDDDDTHTISASSADTTVVTVSVNETDLAITGMVTLAITGVEIGSTTVIVSATDDSGQDNAAAKLVFNVSVAEPGVIASTRSLLMESSLDGSVVTLTLTGLTYKQHTYSGGVMVSGIDGVTLSTTRIVSASQAAVTLEYDGTDFDAEGVLNFVVGPAAIADDYNGGLFTTEVPVIADVVNIQGPWLWMAVPTDSDAGGGVSTEIDSLAKASNNKITEADVAKNSVNEGDTIGEFQWASGSIENIHKVCDEFCSLGLFGVAKGCVTLCWLNNINEILNILGFGTGRNIEAHTAYALINLVSPRDQTDAKLFVRSADTIKVWLNGEGIYRKAATALGCRTVDVPNAFDPTVCTPDLHAPKEFTIPVRLKTGSNFLLVKVRQHGDYWGMVVRLTADFTTEIPKR